MTTTQQTFPGISRANARVTNVAIDYVEQHKRDMVNEPAIIDADLLNDAANEACNWYADADAANRFDCQTVAVALFEHYGVDIMGIV